VKPQLTSAGGHTTEMLRLISGLDHAMFSPRVYVVSQADKMSENRCIESEKGASVVFERIPRSREVRQAWMSSIASSLHTTIKAIPVVLRHAPDVVRGGLNASHPVALVQRPRHMCDSLPSLPAFHGINAFHFYSIA
jgi:hypothetical protein